MKLTESKLRNIIREELQRLTEIDDTRMLSKLMSDLQRHPAVDQVDKNRIGDIIVIADGRDFRVNLKDQDPIDRAPSAADPENWKVKVREKGGGLSGYVNSRTLGQTWGYSDLKDFVVNAIQQATTQR
jgi:hypothetical protein